MSKIRDKKAQIPEAVLILIAIAVCGAALYYSITFNAVKAESVKMDNTAKMFDESERTAFFIQDSAKIALQQAYSEAVKSMDCAERIEGTIPVWSSCRPNNQDIKNKIKMSFDKGLSSINYEFSSEIKEKMSVSFKPINLNASEKSKLVSYNISYSFSPAFSMNYPKIAFEEIYSAVQAKNAECKDKGDDCMSLNFEGWNNAIESTVNYYIFSMFSKQKYFYDNSFKPVEFKFAIKKISSLPAV